MNEIYEIILSDIKQPLWSNWYIKKNIGNGTFSKVYRIEAERFDRTDVSALKIEPVISEETFFNEEQKKNFIERKKLIVKNESDIMYALRDCPNIVRYEDESIKELYIDGNFEGYYFLMRMELLTPVASLIKSKKMDFSEQNIIKLAKHIGQGIKSAHEKGFIHRDIKPANLFVSDDGIYKLGDFNVSKKNITARSVTGTYGYIAPEIYRLTSDDSYTRQADIYSFGICLYQFMNDFYFPFEEKDKIFTDTAIERRMSGESFPKPANASEEFGCIILKACEFDTSKRYQTIDDMLHDLENIGISRPAPVYSPVESAGLCDNTTQYVGEEISFNEDVNATQYAGEYYPEENVTSVAEEAESECYTYDENADTYETESNDENYSVEYDEDLYETNESDFEIKDGVLIKYHGTAEYVKIPYGITKIGDNAFEKCDSIYSVIIPKGVTKIGKYAFGYCSELREVIIPNSVIKIGDSAFRHCGSLYSATIPDSVIEIGKSAFRFCHKQYSVTIPDSVLIIGDGALNSSSLTSVKIPRCFANEIDKIFSYTMDYILYEAIEVILYDDKNVCENYLDYIHEIHRNGFKIEDGILIKYYKHNWSSVKIPDGVTKIGEEAFHYNCLMSVIIPDSVTEIGKKSFCSCEKLSSITIPNSVIKIGEQAFYGCENLTSVTIPNNVTEIGDGAFEWCHNLTSVTIPRRFENDEKRIFALSPKVNISYIEEVKNTDEKCRPLTRSELKEMKKNKKFDKLFKKILGKKDFF